MVTMPFFRQTFFLLLQTIVSCVSVTYNGHYLPGRVHKVISNLDWMGCLKACHDKPACISYNYCKDKKICEINSNGIRDECESKQTIFLDGWIFHQIRPVPPEYGDDPTTAAQSCKEILTKRRNAPSRAYYIKADAKNPKLVYCEMDRTQGCGGGGWTLAMKIDGSKTTFSYNSDLWTSWHSYNESAGKDLSNTETKLDVFRFTTITEGFCVGMKVGADGTKWLKISHPSQHSTAYGIFLSDTQQQNNVGAETWKSLMEGSSMGNCSDFNSDAGFNVRNGDSEVRIGIIRRCNNDVVARIGFGMNTNNTCGNEVGQGIKSIKAFCYIFVK